MLELGSIDGVEYPVEAEDGVKNHSEVVYPRPFVSKHVPEEGMFGVGIAET